MSQKNKFVPAFAVGLFNGSAPACTQIKDIEVDPPIVAGMCVSMIDYVVSKLADDKQIDFEKQTIKLFNYMIENRHEYVSTLKAEKKDETEY